MAHAEIPHNPDRNSRRPELAGVGLAVKTETIEFTAEDQAGRHSVQRGKIGAQPGMAFIPYPQQAAQQSFGTAPHSFDPEEDRFSLGGQYGELVKGKMVELVFSARHVHHRVQKDLGFDHAAALVAITQSAHCGKIAAGGISGDAYLAGIAAQGGGVGVHPLEGFPAIIESGGKGMLRGKPVFHLHRDAA